MRPSIEKWREIMRAATFVGLLLILSTADIASTWYLLNNVPGEEVNPFVNTQSLMGIIFSPIPNFVDFVFLVCVFLSERHQKKFDALVASRSLRAAIFFFPMYYLFTLTITVISNFTAVLGFSTPMSHLLNLFSFFSENTFVQLGLVYSFAIMITLPLFVRLAKAIYGTRPD